MPSGSVCGFLGFEDVDRSIGATVTAHTFRLIRLSFYKEQILKDQSERTYDYAYVVADQNPLSFVVVPVFHRRIISNPAASSFWPKVSVLATNYDPSPEHNFENSEYVSNATCFGTTPAHPISALPMHINDYARRYVENQMADVPVRNEVYRSNLFMVAHPDELWELRTITSEVMTQLQASAEEVTSDYFSDYYPYDRSEIANDYRGTDEDEYIGVKMSPGEISDRARSGARTYCDRLGYRSLVGYDLTFSRNEGSQSEPRYVWDVALNDWRAEYDPGDITELNVMGFDVQMPMLYLHNIICSNG